MNDKITPLFLDENTQKQVLDNTIFYLEHYLKPDRKWGRNTTPKQRIDLIRYADVNWQTVSCHIRSMPYYDFLNTPYWKAIADHTKYKAGYRCQLCNSNHKLATHHRNYRIHGFEHANMQELIVICESCHNKFHDRLPKAKPDFELHRRNSKIHHYELTTAPKSTAIRKISQSKFHFRLLKKKIFKIIILMISFVIFASLLSSNNSALEKITPAKPIDYKEFVFSKSNGTGKSSSLNQENKESKAVDNLLAAQKFAIGIRSKTDGFPYLAEALRKFGISRNIWNLPSCKNIYLTKYGSVVCQGTPIDITTVNIPPFNRETLIKVIKNNQANQRTFPEFLKALWEAGVVRYEVDFEKRKVTYYGLSDQIYSVNYPAVEIKSD